MRPVAATLSSCRSPTDASFRSKRTDTGRPGFVARLRAGAGIVQPVAWSGAASAQPSSEVLESIIGKYKSLQGEHGQCGATSMLLSIGAFVGRLTQNVMRTAMTTDYDRHLGPMGANPPWIDHPIPAQTGFPYRPKRNKNGIKPLGQEKRDRLRQAGWRIIGAGVPRIDRGRDGPDRDASGARPESEGTTVGVRHDPTATCFPGGFQSIANCQDGVSGSRCIHRPIRSVAVETWCNTPGGRANHRAKSRHSRRVTTAITGRQELIRYQKKPRHRRSVASHGDIAS
jgi:hypothetical protein